MDSFRKPASTSPLPAHFLPLCLNEHILGLPLPSTVLLCYAYLFCLSITCVPYSQLYNILACRKLELPSFCKMRGGCFYSASTQCVRPHTTTLISLRFPSTRFLLPKPPLILVIFCVGLFIGKPQLYWHTLQYRGPIELCFINVSDICISSADALCLKPNRIVLMGPEERRHLIKADSFAMYKMPLMSTAMMRR